MQTPDDIAAALKATAVMLEAQKQAGDAISHRRGRMVLGLGPGGKYDANESFYASLAIRLKPVAVGPEGIGGHPVETMATDGESLFYNPLWVAGLDTAIKGPLHATIIHECVHCANQHFARMPPECKTDRAALFDANIAGDLAINGPIRDSGYKLPNGGLFPGEGKFADFPVGLSMEQYYKMLRKARKEGKHPLGPGVPGDGAGMPGGIMPGPGTFTPEQVQTLAQEWKLTVAKAEAAAKQRGDISAGLDRMIGGVLRPAHDLDDVIREYICRVRHDKANWNTRNRRFADVYLPAKLNHTLGEIVLVLDTSGSIDQDTLRHASEITQGVIEQNPAQLTVIYHDSKVCGVQSWVPGDPELVLKPVGGGGTSHVPVFKEIGRRMADRDVSPDLVICLTDCYTDYPKAAPDYDVVWARFGGGGTKPPFGRLVDVKAT